MYILVKNTLPAGLAAVSIAHASLGTYLEFAEGGWNPVVKDWLLNSFKKVICSVTPEEFEEAKQFERGILFTESNIDRIDPNAVNNETCLGFEPREMWPDQFKKYKLYGSERKEVEYIPGRLCVVSNWGHMRINKEFLDKVCVIVKKTKSGLIQVCLRDDDRKTISVPPNNICFHDYPSLNRVMKDAS